MRRLRERAFLGKLATARAIDPIKRTPSATVAPVPLALPPIAVKEPVRVSSRVAMVVFGQKGGWSVVGGGAVGWFGPPTTCQGVAERGGRQLLRPERLLFAP